MTRRAIQRADEAMVRRVAMRALGGSAAVLFWNGPGAALSGIQVDMGGGHSRVMRDREVEALDAAGIHPGASGWEIEDAAGATRRPLPEGWAWLDGVYLTRRDDGASEIAEAKMDEATIYASESSAVIAARIPARDTAHAREIAERVCWDRGLLTPEASPARPPLPSGFGWFERGVDSYSLDGPDGKPIARARASTVVPGTGVWQIGDGPWWPVASLPDAKRAAEDACRAAGIFVASRPLPDGWLWRQYEGTEEEYLSRTEERYAQASAILCDGKRWFIYADRDEEVTSQGRGDKAAVERECWALGLFDASPPESMLLYQRVAEILGIEAARTDLDVRIERVEVDGVEIGEGTLDVLRAAGFKVRPKVEAMPDRAAARALRKAIAAVCDPGDNQIVDSKQGEKIDGRCVAFVRELRREVAPAEKSRGLEDAAGAFVGSRVERSTDAALTSYLAEHYPNERRPGEDALALAIRLLAEQRSEIRAAWSAHEAAREEARVADENAAELAADLKRIREDILKAAADLAARMGAPHG